MNHRLDVSLTAPVGIDDVVAVVTLESGETAKVVLRGGRLAREFSVRPTSIRLTTDPAPPGEGPLGLASPDVPGSPDGIAVDVMELFEHGYRVPENGSVVLHLLWGCHCHSDRMPAAPEGKRFASAEHMVCADFVGLDRVSDAGDALPLTFNRCTASPARAHALWYVRDVSPTYRRFNP
jgi:hypothetical protein